MNKDKLYAAIIIAIAFMFGYYTDFLFHEKIYMFLKNHARIKIIPYIIIGYTVLSECGWRIQTHGSETTAERLDKYLFRALYIISFYCALVIFFVEHA